MKKLKWGIIGTGMIAHKMADALQLLPNAEITTVLSRSEEKGKKFAGEYNFSKVYTHLEQFANSKEFDIAYIATPHNKHHNEAIHCLNAGKHVLCEKPMGVNLKEVEEMVQTARKNKVFLAEAYWTYYFPAVKKALELLHNGAIGKPLMVDARFCFWKDFNAADRKFNPDLAGGALLDIGLYCITLPQMVFNEYPAEIKSMPAKGVTGVDESSAYILRYSENRMASLTSSFKAITHNDGWIFGEKGMIRIPMFWQPDECYLIKDGTEEKFSFNRLGNGYTYEAEAIMNYIENHQTESEIFDLNKSIEMIKILDTIRNDWGLKYPFEH